VNYLVDFVILVTHNDSMNLTRVIPLVLISVAALGACGQTQLPEVPIRISNEGVTHPTNLAPTLVQRFYITNESKREKEIRLEPSYRGLKYQPRYVQYANYAGWDGLTVPKSDSARADWLTVKLNRAATVVVVWKLSASWLADWTASTDVAGGYKTYKKSFPAGDFKLPSPGKSNEAYEVLFAESNGQPSVAPILAPQAPAGAELPKPNQTCPDWLHHLYEVTGRDGNKYDSWHPQIDPVYWCYFKHEHGSDPALIGYNGAALEYVAKLFNDQAEIHEGFKSFVIRDDTAGIGWYISVHAETGFEHRVCTQNHTMVIAAVGLKDTALFTSGELLVELGFKGDFGASITNNQIGGKNFVIQKTTLQGGKCANQQAIFDATQAAKSKAAKRIRVAADGFGNNGYEGWDGGIQKELGFSFPDWNAGIAIDIRNPSTACATLECTALVRNQNDHGDERTIFMSGLKLAYKKSLDTVNGSPADGVFYSDLYGSTFFDANGAGRIRQFVKPNLNLTLPDGFYTTEDAWRGLYVKDGSVPRTELEDALGEIN
jgi:hypothetical protein